VIFVKLLNALIKGLKNLFNVQRFLTNVEKVIKLYLQRFFTCLSTYHIKITICSSLNKHTPNILSHILYPKGIPLDYIKTFFSRLVTTLYFMSNMQWNMDLLFLENFNFEKSSQCSFIFYRPL
jgi:hypothetical protein